MRLRTYQHTLITFLLSQPYKILHTFLDTPCKNHVYFDFTPSETVHLNAAHNVKIKTRNQSRISRIHTSKFLPTNNFSFNYF